MDNPQRGLRSPELQGTFTNQVMMATPNLSLKRRADIFDVLNVTSAPLCAIIRIHALTNSLVEEDEDQESSFAIVRRRESFAENVKRITPRKLLIQSQVILRREVRDTLGEGLIYNVVWNMRKMLHRRRELEEDTIILGTQSCSMVKVAAPCEEKWQTIDAPGV
ncbi:hypothetical protein B7494_g8417 [Chlorociboria aeruginascens]|nr:hypothetical protein B7494_g8417 [Chlorociboria aeruginascens]